MAAGAAHKRRARPFLPRRAVAAPTLEEPVPKGLRWEDNMSESVYRVIEVIGTSSDSWERAAKVAVERAADSLRDLRVAEVVEQDVQLKDGKVELYRVKMNLSFKYDPGKE